jgi:hypothetical protein
VWIIPSKEHLLPPPPPRGGVNGGNGAVVVGVVTRVFLGPGAPPPPPHRLNYRCEKYCILALSHLILVKPSAPGLSYDIQREGVALERAPMGHRWR